MQKTDLKDPRQRPTDIREKGGPCPKCGSPTKVRRAKKTGELYFGCTNYPDCNFNGTRSY